MSETEIRKAISEVASPEWSRQLFERQSKSLELAQQAAGGHFPGCACILCAGNVPSRALMTSAEYRATTDAQLAALEAKYASVMAAKMEGSDADHPVATDRETVARHVREIIEDFGAGRVNRQQASDVARAAERAIADLDVARSIGKL